MECVIKTPAQLWIGPSLDLVDAVEQYLQDLFCPNKKCFTCIVCLAIRQRQHHAIMWFNPSGSYTLELLKPFFNTISCCLMPHQQFYFIFENADHLSHACSNSLLKSIEEPPQGYNFIFLASHEHALVPTLRSRCALHKVEKKPIEQESHPLVDCFTTRLHDSEFFLQCLEKMMPDEFATPRILEKIINYWSLAYCNTLQDTQMLHRIFTLIDSCKKAVQKPPMPGSAKIFWRNLFLQCTY